MDPLAVDAPGATTPHDHVVQLYESHDFLTEIVRDFIAPSVEAGEAAVVIATHAHRRSLEDLLAQAGIDLDGATDDGRYVAIDAAETLQTFMVGESPDPDRFRSAIGGVIESAAAGGRRVRAFGEMVALLWADGNVMGAIELEELWNELALTQPFSLLCAYPIDAFTGDPSGAAFLEVCSTHSQVVPSETYSRAATEEQRLRNVAVTQQKAIAGEYETEALRLKQIELETALEQVRNLDRMRNEFVAMVVHDIRSPMSVISGFLELLRDNLYSLPEDEVHELIDKGIDNTKKVARLADDVLTVARLDSGEFTYNIKSFDLAESIYRTTAEIRAASRDARLKVSIPADLPPALGDEGRHMQVLNNLLTNAIKFSGHQPLIVVTACRRDDMLAVSVRDYGPGIAPADMPRLFQRFSRLTQPQGSNVNGTGLGLYICKGLVEGQGGSISVESEPGKGCKFTYTIPMDRPS